MRRGAKPTKPKVGAKRQLARKSPQDEDSRVRDLEKRLAEALNREAEALARGTATAGPRAAAPSGSSGLRSARYLVS
jgi:hypothetical protein